MRTPEERLRELGLTLPQPPAPLASYVPVVVVGELLYTSGVLPMWDGEVRWRGVIGDGLTVADGVQAARLCALNILSAVRAALGSLDAVAQLVQVSGFVRSANGFVNQPRVINGASDLLVEILGERGRHARMALGASELPLGAAVEISAVMRVDRAATVTAA
ncbi:MAG TPA: RidA family protein [Candidatus Dormibacteraeota bacterium]|nr:RidA family protein [Candidatus Dormibacteraeota bacterium]